MYLHEDREQFADAVRKSVQHTNMSEMIIEKDYYVTMILRLLSQKLPYVVFKGGTSLSKCHKVIKRFSEDIRSRRDYNRYQIEYKSAFEIGEIPISSFVLLETSFTAVSFPTVMMAVTNYIGGVMEEEAPEMIGKYHIGPFEMKVQGLDRTLIDKVFAICDYYMQNRIKKHSRHIYDIYKLLPLVEMDESFKRLVEEVRAVRKCSNICPSAQDDVDIPALLQLITEQEIYKDDYQNLTEALLEEAVIYETAVGAVEKIRVSGMFEKC